MCRGIYKLKEGRGNTNISMFAAPP
uniref:Uncharacterized protein n=1 Tax=Anguilla anguilla TaxID=7936 RepID=A0A0E9S7E1_ANGAN